MQPSVVRTQPPRWPAILAATLTGAWIVLVTAVLQGLGWLVAEILIEAELGTPFWLWPAVNLANAFLALLPAILLAVLPKSPTVRAIGRLWTAAAAALAVVGLDRAVPVVHNELTLAVLAVLAAILATWRAGASVTPAHRGTGSGSVSRRAWPRCCPGCGSARSAASPRPFSPPWPGSRSAPWPRASSVDSTAARWWSPPSPSRSPWCRSRPASAAAGCT